MRPHAPMLFAPPASAARRRAVISLTPLIDVVFILLIFFMLASSFLNWRSIELAAPAQAVPGASHDDALSVRLHADGLMINGAVVTLDDLTVQVQEHLIAAPEGRVLVEVTPGVPLQDAITVVDRLAAVGAVDLSLVRVETEERRGLH